MPQTSKKRPSIRDVAERAGVSITTVSHALNGRGRVLPATRDRVLDIANQLGYIANVHAQGLASGIHKTVALQVSGYGPEIMSVDSAYYIDLLNSASTTAMSLGYMPILVPPDLNRRFPRVPADGAVILDPIGTEPLLESILDGGGTVVTTGRPLSSRQPVSGWVDNNLADLTVEVMDHLERVGYEQPALITGPEERSYAADTIDAYRDWMIARDKDPIIKVVRANPTVEVAMKAAHDLLDRIPRPDSIYASFDVFALGALRAADSIGLDVPQDLGIVATVDSQGMRSSSPTLTAIKNNPRILGKRAIEMLIELMTGEIVGPASEIIPTELQVRESTARSVSLLPEPTGSPVREFTHRSK